MNWKQNLADYFGYKNFEDMDTSDRSVAEKAVELYQKELNEKLKNVGLSISELVEEKEPEKSKPSWVEQNSDFIQEALDG